MKAMILAAGKGRRLGELGRRTPKCLLRAGGKTMLEHLVIRLKNTGVKEIVINLHHLDEQVRNFVREKNSFSLRIHFSYEKELLDTGGAVKAARKWLSDRPFFVCNADIFCDAPLERLAQAHHSLNAAATLLTCPTDDFRTLLFDRHGELAGWRDRKTGKEKIPSPSPDGLETRGYGGIQVLSPEIFEVMETQGRKFSIVDTWLTALTMSRRIHEWRADGYFWIDVGTIGKINRLKRYLA